MKIGYRIGSFLYLIGTSLVVIFILSVLGKEINLAYLILAVIAFFFGSLFRKTKENQESKRFSTIRRIRNRKDQSQNEDQQNG